MKEEIIKFANDQLLSINDNGGLIKKIMTRQFSENGEFSSLTKTDLESISQSMVEVNRATNSFGKTQSQFMNYIMTVSGYSPYRNLRQILAEVERRRMALKENIFSVKKKIIKLAKKKEKLNNLIAEDDEEKNKYEIALLQIDIEEAEAGIADGRLYIEGALKHVYGYMKAYNDIKQKNNIPDDWDEKDFESMEEDYHIKRAFEQAHADVMATGRITQGNHEYFRQCGINPQNAFSDLLSYMSFVDGEMKTQAETGLGLNELNIGIDSFSQFLNNMALKYKGASKRILELKGINSDGFYEEALFMDKNFQL